MIETRLSLPQIGLIAGTRGVLGAGVGLLLGGKLDKGQRSKLGWTLVAIGAASTIPLLVMALRSAGKEPEPDRSEPVSREMADSREAEAAAW